MGLEPASHTSEVLAEDFVCPIQPTSQWLSPVVVLLQFRSNGGSCVVEVCKIYILMFTRQVLRTDRIYDVAILTAGFFYYMYEDYYVCTWRIFWQLHVLITCSQRWGSSRRWRTGGPPVRTSWGRRGRVGSAAQALNTAPLVTSFNCSVLRYKTRDN